ncbi:MAG: adenylyltransferase/cytidyltransferase family protein [Candidatus Brocadiales bacterium]|nr:adenylyltransferase/cytidyltransferase family protein [Candidatus Brocadiales bacterium]
MSILDKDKYSKSINTVRCKDKILKQTDLIDKVRQATKANCRIVVCHGHFNVLHPGHLRFLQYASEQGDQLLVAVLGDKLLIGEEKKRYFSQSERAEGVAALQSVDWVVILDEICFDKVIDIVKPSVYVLGKEFEKDHAEKVRQNIVQVKANNGKVIFCSGDVQYASADFLYHPYEEIEHDRVQKFQEALQRHDIELERLEYYISQFQRLKLAVIGDTIVDQYVACDALGMSAEAPVIAVKELETKEFIGGASIVASHLRSLGAQCHYFSVVGDDQPGQFVREQLTKVELNHCLFVDNGRPTTFKIRYMVNNQKLFRVSRLHDNSISKELESQIISRLKQLAQQLDGIIISDFVYGVISDSLLSSIIRIARKNKIKLFGDLQCSTQVGNVLKFKQFDFICPTEREARLALSDHESGLEKLALNILKLTKTTNLLITLGTDGFVAHQTANGSKVIKSQHFPALISNPVDVVGAGDALLSVASISQCSGASLMEASALGTCAAAIAVNRIGNNPVTATELVNFIRKSMAYVPNSQPLNE